MVYFNLINFEFNVILGNLAGAGKGIVHIKRTLHYYDNEYKIILLISDKGHYACYLYTYIAVNCPIWSQQQLMLLLEIDPLFILDKIGIPLDGKMGHLQLIWDMLTQSQ